MTRHADLPRPSYRASSAAAAGRDSGRTCSPLAQAAGFDETEFFVQADRGRVVSLDRADHRVLADGLRGGDQRRQQQRGDSCPRRPLST